jgi:hypothetical protein
MSDSHDSQDFYLIEHDVVELKNPEVDAFLEEFHKVSKEDLIEFFNAPSYSSQAAYAVTVASNLVPSKSTVTAVAATGLYVSSEMLNLTSLVAWSLYKGTEVTAKLSKKAAKSLWKLSEEQQEKQ